MYGAHESSANGTTTSGGGGSNSSVYSAYKDTLHISPHIAAHKSTPTTSLVNLSAVPPGCSSTAMLAPICSSQDPAMSYKLVTSHSAVAEMHQTYSTMRAATSQPYTSYRKEDTTTPGNLMNIVSSIASKEHSSVQSSIINNAVTSRANLANLSRALPEDLSASSSEVKQHNNNNNNSHSGGVIASQYISNNATTDKSGLPHIYTVAGQMPTSLFPLDKTSAYFRPPHDSEGGAGVLTGQPQAIIVSGLVACGDSNMQHNNAIAALPSSSIVGEVSYY